MNRHTIIRAARSLVGTPFHHAGRVPGVGLDCPGVVALTASRAGYAARDALHYGVLPKPGEMLPVLRLSFDEIPVADLQPGDVMVMWMDRHTREPQHLGVRTDRGLVHAWADVKKVVETSDMRHWDFRCCNVFQFRGVAPWQP